MKNSQQPLSVQRRAVPSVTPYPRASRICSRHGSSITGQGARQVYARNTFVTQDSQEQVLQYYSQQFGEPRQQQSGSLCWQQEQTNNHQHVLIELKIEHSTEQTPSASEQTLIKSYCVVTVNPQSS